MALLLIMICSDQQRCLGSHGPANERNSSDDIQWVRLRAWPIRQPMLTPSCSSQDFYEIMDMLDKRLNDKGKNWRHILKSLKVLDYCLHEGSELVITWARKNVYIIKTLREFVHLDDDGRDVGRDSRSHSSNFQACCTEF
jgi:ENTH domain